MPTILIVEDEEDTRTMLRDFLQLEGYQVSTAPNGRDGLASIRAVRPCLILLDLMMPVMNGFEFRAEQVRDPQLADIPVVCISAVYNHRDVTSRLGLPCLPKPMEPDALLQVVASHCGPASGATELLPAST